MDTKQPIVPSAGFSLQAMHAVPPSRNPAFVYIASLAAGSRRTMRDALQTIVDVLLGYAPGNADANPNRAVSPDGESAHCLLGCVSLARARLPAYSRHAALVSHYKKRTVVKMLSAMRRVLKECWRLGYITVEQYQRCRSGRVAGNTAPQADRSACRAGRGRGAAQAMRRWIARRCA